MLNKTSQKRRKRRKRQNDVKHTVNVANIKNITTPALQMLSLTSPMLIPEAFQPTKVLEFSEETFLVNKNNYKENYITTLPISFELEFHQLTNDLC